MKEKGVKMMICGKKFWLKGMLDMKSIRCPKCRMELELPRDYKGQNVLCPGCGFKFAPSKYLRFALCAVRYVQCHITVILLVILIILAGYNTWQIGRNNLKNYNRFIELRNDISEIEYKVDEMRGGDSVYSDNHGSTLSGLYRKLEEVEEKIGNLEDKIDREKQSAIVQPSTKRIKSTWY